jgi:hypothetical protein
MRNPIQNPTGTGADNVHGLDQTLWRLFFLGELAVCVLLVLGVWKFIFGGELTELWPGAMFCYAVVLAIVVDTFVKRLVFHRRPLFSPVFAVLTCLFFLAAGIGLSMVMIRG